MLAAQQLVQQFAVRRPLGRQLGALHRPLLPNPYLPELANPNLYEVSR
jgi:hypothetical protein